MESIGAVALAAIGIYGLMAFLVSQRTQEIGIRMALGARRVDVIGMILRRGLSLAFLGVGVGLAAAFGMGQLMSSLLYEVSATDPVVFLTVPLGLLGIALLACYIPARRAASLDPNSTLRYE